MAYTDTTKISNYLQRSLTAYETAMLTTIIPAVKLWIDRKLGTTFDSGTSSTRYYEGGGHSLDIDPCVNISAVTAYNDDASASYAYTENTEYVAEPVNETVKRELVRRGDACWPKGLRRIGVTATFSEYASGVPEDIQTLATVLASGIINSGKIASSGGNVSSESLEGHSVSYDTSASAIDDLADGNPIVQNILGSRKEIMI